MKMNNYTFTPTDLIHAVPEFQFSESSALRAAKIINTTAINKALAQINPEDQKAVAFDEIRRQITEFYDAEMIAGLLVCQLRSRLGSEIALNAMLDGQIRLHEVVREKSGLSTTVSSIVNRAGFESQVAVLEDALGWGETKLIVEEILGIDIFPLFETNH
jgi:hypothetical protein